MSNTQPTLYREDFKDLGEANKWAKRKSLQVKNVKFVVFHECTNPEHRFTVCTMEHYAIHENISCYTYEIWFNGESGTTARRKAETYQLDMEMWDGSEMWR